MSGLFWLLMLFAAAVAVALGATLNDGYVLIVLPPWRAEVSLNLLLIVLGIVFVGFYALLRVLAVTAGLPARVGAYRARQRKEKSGLIFQDAVRLLFEGRFGQALKRADEAWASGVAPGLSALIAARAAQRMRESAKQQEWLDRAKAVDPRNEASALMLEAEMMNEEGRFDEALAALARLQGKLGRHIAALRLELRARQGTGDWDGVLKLLRQLAKRDALPAEMVREVRTKAHLANIAQRAGDEKALVSYLRKLPVEERGRRVVLAAVRALTAEGAELEAQKLIEATLDSGDDDAWQDELLAIYASLAGGDQTSRIARGEHWLLSHPRHAGLLLALGRMCGRQRLWGKAQSYLEASLGLAETQAACLELARLHDQLEQTEVANRYYRDSVRIGLR